MFGSSTRREKTRPKRSVTNSRPLPKFRSSGSSNLSWGKAGGGGRGGGGAAAAAVRHVGRRRGRTWGKVRGNRGATFRFEALAWRPPVHPWLVRPAVVSTGEKKSSAGANRTGPPPEFAG